MKEYEHLVKNAIHQFQDISDTLRQLNAVPPPTQAIDPKIPQTSNKHDTTMTGSMHAELFNLHIMMQDMVIISEIQGAEATDEEQYSTIFTLVNTLGSMSDTDKENNASSKTLCDAVQKRKEMYGPTYSDDLENELAFNFHTWNNIVGVIVERLPIIRILLSWMFITALIIIAAYGYATVNVTKLDIEYTLEKLVVGIQSKLVLRHYGTPPY